MELAFEQGRYRERVDQRLNNHEARLNAINGSIEKQARNAGALRDSVEAVRDQVASLAATIATQAAVEADRVKQIKEANQKQISSRQFWVGVAVVMVGILGLLLTILTKAHGA